MNDKKADRTDEDAGKRKGTATINEFILNP